MDKLHTLALFFGCIIAAPSHTIRHFWILLCHLDCVLGREFVNLLLLQQKRRLLCWSQFEDSGQRWNRRHYVNRVILIVPSPQDAWSSYAGKDVLICQYRVSWQVSFQIFLHKTRRWQNGWLKSSFLCWLNYDEVSTRSNAAEWITVLTYNHFIPRCVHFFLVCLLPSTFRDFNFFRIDASVKSPTTHHRSARITLWWQK